MGFDQPSSMNTSLFWIPQTPPTMPRFDYNKNRSGLYLHNKKHNNASSLNRNFGSSVLQSNGRYPIGHVRNVFNYSPTSYQSNCLPFMPSNNNHFDCLSKYKPPNNNSYGFGSHSLSHKNTPTYNTVHARKLTNDVIYDTTADEYEDLDSYDKSPFEKIKNNLSLPYNVI